MEIIIGMIKIMTLNNANTCTLWEYRIILKVLIVCLFLEEITFPKTLFRNMIRAPNSLHPDQVSYFVGPDLGSKCLQSRGYHEQS